MVPYLWRIFITSFLRILTTWVTQKVFHRLAQAWCHHLCGTGTGGEKMSEKQDRELVTKKSINMVNAVTATAFDHREREALGAYLGTTSYWRKQTSWHSDDRLSTGEEQIKTSKYGKHLSTENAIKFCSPWFTYRLIRGRFSICWKQNRGFSTNWGSSCRKQQFYFCWLHILSCSDVVEDISAWWRCCSNLRIRSLRVAFASKTPFGLPPFGL